MNERFCTLVVSKVWSFLTVAEVMSDELEEPLSREYLGKELLLCARYGEEEDLETILSFQQKEEESNDVISVDVNYVDSVSGNTALHFAAANGHINCIGLLHRYEAKFMLNNEGCSPVHWWDNKTYYLQQALFSNLRNSITGQRRINKQPHSNIFLTSI